MRASEHSDASDRRYRSQSITALKLQTQIGQGGGKVFGRFTEGAMILHATRAGNRSGSALLLPHDALQVIFSNFGALSKKDT